MTLKWVLIKLKLNLIQTITPSQRILFSYILCWHVDILPPLLGPPDVDPDGQGGESGQSVLGGVWTGPVIHMQ